MIKLLALASAIGALTVPNAGHADGRCMGRALRDSQAIENANSVMPRGQVWGPITQVRVARRNGEISYCSKGGYCYFAGGVELVSPCAIDSAPQPPLPPIGLAREEWIYYVR